MKPNLLISGARSSFTTLALDLEQKVLSVIANYPSPYNVSWVELSASQRTLDRLIGLSEGTESGLLYTFEIEHTRRACEITSQRPTLGAPAHFITLCNGSAVALSTYLGGSAALYPISITKAEGLLLTDSPRTEVQPNFPYQLAGHGPNKGRQRQCHVHQILEDTRGLLYAPDLGADRVWILRRGTKKLEICGWLQCPPGTGARHAVITPDDLEKIIYVIGELSHTVVAFDLPSSPAEDIQAIPGFAPKVIPPSVDPGHQLMMDSAEICLHPKIPNILYVSNRWERHIGKREPYLNNLPKELPPGDAIAIILLSENGRKVERIKFLRTGLDVIRGMRFKDDGKYIAVVGQEGGGVEIYGVGGARGDGLTLVAGLNEGLESGIKHVVWL